MNQKESKKEYSINMDMIFNDPKYQDLVNHISYEKFCMDMKNNQGITLDEIYEKWGCEKSHCETLLNIWTKNWNTFYHNGGRLVNENGKYYMLSPRNPQSRARNPKINLL
tara:strand:+ start:317 stop:646 length:330 start_codon:yes stop_codon:yes gene_type:complete